MFWTWFFGIVSLFLFGLLIIAVCYLWKFIKIIMVFEDDLADAIEALNETETRIDDVIALEFFFNDEQVKNLLYEMKNSLRISKYNVNRVSTNFVRRSKQQYIRVIEEPSDKDILGEEISAITSLPTTPREGTVANVSRPKTNQK